jgi:hypothetical protein
MGEPQKIEIRGGTEPQRKTIDGAKTANPRWR